MTPPAGATPCSEGVRQLLSAYLDGETTADEAALVEAHLPACPACRGELDGLRETACALAALSRSDPAAAPPDFVRQVETTIRRRSRDRFYADRPGRRARTLTGGRPAGGAPRITYNAVAATLLVVMASGAAALQAEAPAPAPRLTGPAAAVALEARAFRIAAGGLPVARVQEVAEAAGATDLRPLPDGSLDLRAPRGQGDRLVEALRRAGAGGVEPLPAPGPRARGDRVVVFF